MLIEQADEQQLTRTLMEDAKPWSPDALLSADDGVVYDAERTTRLLAAWAQVVAAGTKSAVPLFTAVPEAQEPWAKLGVALAETADQGAVGLLQKAARQCATEAQPQDRARLLARLATGTAPLVQLAGGLDELVEAAALHRRCSGGTEAGWVATAAWVVCALTENAQNTTVASLASDRIAHLIGDGRGADLWHTWPRVAASMMSTAFLEEMQPLDPGLPGYPVGLWRRAVEAVHAQDDRAVDATVAEFRAQDEAEHQRVLCFELAMAIAAVRARPSRRAARGATDPYGEGLRSTLGGIFDEMPAELAERTGRMYALSRRAVLAYIDEDPETLAAVISRIATWDDDPGRIPYPLPRFQYAGQQTLALANDLLNLGETTGAHITDFEVSIAAAPLVDRYAPDEYKQAAQELIGALRRSGKGGVDFNPTAADGPAGLVAFAAMAAAVTQNPRLRLPRERTRLNLIKEIRESEAKALQIPDREMITDISDDEALAFLKQLYGPDYPLPRDPGDRAVWEHDVIAVIKQHLLEYPADATTPEQRRTLDGRVKGLLRAAAGTPRPTPPPPGRHGVVRNQPKRASKKKRRGK
jgi:hypothetical protein